MKNKIVLFVLVIIGFTAQAQGLDGNFNQLSLEGAYGMSIPLNYSSSVPGNNFNSVSHFDGGIRYMLMQDWGIKGMISYDKFTGNDANLGMQSIVLDAQAHYNLGKAIGLVHGTKEKVGLFLHSGFGLSINKSVPYNMTEHSGVYILGLSPLFKISDHFALSTDLSYKLTLKQHMHFDGTFFEIPTVTNNNTSQISLTVGGIIYLGSAKRHADWY
jgi:hypothetical protein